MYFFSELFNYTSRAFSGRVRLGFSFSLKRPNSVWAPANLILSGYGVRLSQQQSSWVVKLTTHNHRAPSLRGVTPPLHRTFMACRGTALPFGQSTSQLVGSVSHLQSSWLNESIRYYVWCLAGCLGNHLFVCVCVWLIRPQRYTCRCVACEFSHIAKYFLQQQMLGCLRYN